MAGTFRTALGIGDPGIGWKTYYIRIEADGGVFYKIGRCTGSVRGRFSRERSDLEIELLQVWNHPSQAAAERHEAALFKKYRGDLPFIGRCGPFRHGGNVETFSHDVIGGEPGPHRYIARAHSIAHGILYMFGYSGQDPRLRYGHLIGQVRYMGHVDGPGGRDEGGYIHVEALSSEDAIILATSHWLEDYLEPYRPAQRQLPKAIAREALLNGPMVRRWSDYSGLRFLGKGFRPPSWVEWF